MPQPLPTILREKFGDVADLNELFPFIRQRDAMLHTAPHYVRDAMRRAHRASNRLTELQLLVIHLYGREPRPAFELLRDPVFRRIAEQWTEVDQLVDAAESELTMYARTVVRNANDGRKIDVDRGARVLGWCRDELMSIRGLLHRISQ